MKIIANPKFLPTLLIVLNVLTAIRYGFATDWKHSIYWTASAILLGTVTY